MKAEVVRCQGCGAVLPFDGNNLTVTCEYCGTRNVVQNERRSDGSDILKKARHWKKAGKNDKAAKCYLQAIDEDPFNADACYEFLEVATKGFSEKAYFISELDMLKDAWACTINSDIDHDRLNKMIAYMKEVIAYAEDHHHSDTFLYTYSCLLNDAVDALSDS